MDEFNITVILLIITFFIMMMMLVNWVGWNIHSYIVCYTSVMGMIILRFVEIIAINKYLGGK